MIGEGRRRRRAHQPLLEACATDVVHVGPLGSAMSLKIINNLVSLVQIIVAEEAVPAGRAERSSGRGPPGGHDEQRRPDADDDGDRLASGTAACG